MWLGKSRPTRDWALSMHNRILNTHSLVTSHTCANYPLRVYETSCQRCLGSDISKYPYPSFHIQVSKCRGGETIQPGDHLAKPHRGILSNHVARDEPSNRGTGLPARTTESSILVHL
ncbi:hypothetical protein Pyn_25004 [Prunus yedoensis var. nudiflora]|uniref:Uncharacterized protein n=1 Tax=Prunus yedoensis var. nudiflora TaxID=2094558 RepID=A0A314Y9A6_PRUYE|nr:hypothetical protein Pyn_25004 [Prunus yedoensis var. nudiflora]